MTRLCNIYGEQDTNHRLIPHILDCLVRDEPVSVYVDENDETKSPLINLLYIDDLMLSFRKIFKRMEERPILYDPNNPENIIINIANHEYSIRVVVEKMFELYGKELNVVYNRKPIAYSKTIDISRSSEKFGFQEMHSLEEGLRKVIDYTKKNHDKMLSKRRNEV